MSKISVNLSNSLGRRLQELAEREDISTDQSIATAVAEKMSALLTEEVLEQRDRHGSRAKYEAVLSRVPDVEPDERDRRALPAEYVAGVVCAACSEPRLSAAVEERQHFFTSNIRSAMLGFARITFDPDVMGGRACIRDTRVPVSLLVNLVANGMDRAEIVDAYPYIEEEDIRQALQYAAWLTEENIDAAA